MDSLKITIAGAEYTIRPLTVGQLEELHVGTLGTTDPKTDLKSFMREWWQQTREIIVTALSEDHPEMTMDVVKKLKIGTFSDAKTIREDILIFAGFEKPRSERKLDVPDGDKPEGEAPAAAE